MNVTNWIVLLTSTLILAGCASPGTVGVGTDAVSANDQLLDNDTDGVLDSVDECPDSAAKILVDENGCELALGVVRGLTFEPGQVGLTEDAKRILARYVSVLKRYPDVVVSLEAHTDNRGIAADNLQLSKQRVLSVARYMVSNGIPPARLKPYGLGESRPRAANATATGREQNRRIEINVVDGLL